jgi:voltage-gated potassium channel
MEVHYTIEWIIVIWFTCEYLLRLYAQPKRLSFVFSFHGIIDLLSIAPSFVADGNLIYLKALRTLRILRFLRYLADEEFFFGTLTKMGLQVVRVVYTLITLIFISSAAIYECENLLRGGNIATYFDAVYFTVITLSTVGYGDYTPLTHAGRFVTVVMIFSGVIFIPWQAGKLMRIILVLSEDKREVHCKKCGLTRHDQDAVHCKMCGDEIYQEYDGV